MAAERNGLVMISFMEDPTIKRVLQQEAFKVRKPLSEVIRELTHEWLAQRGVKIKAQKISRGGSENVVS